MKGYQKQFAIVMAQIFFFYLFPPMSKPMGAMGAVLILMLATFALSALMGRITAGKIKWGYPVLVGLLFVPSVFLYYNESALIHAVWYLVIAFVGISLGAIIKSE